MKTDIDFTFIGHLEGNTREACVPDPEKSESGVSVGKGFDIGARCKAELINAFPMPLALKLLPYTTYKGSVAVEKLKEHPLVLSEAEVGEINKFAKEQATKRLIKAWRDSDSDVAFNMLSPECQTVVASVAYQYGNLASRTPNFWRQVTRGKWHTAVANLRDFKDRYPTRRNKEADLLESWLIAKSAAI